jgi:hypothetical protein
MKSVSECACDVNGKTAKEYFARKFPNQHREYIN